MSIAFDTLKFAEKLEAGGFTSAQARAAAEAFADATGEQLATKADLRELGTDLRAEMAKLGAATKADVAAVKADVARLESATKADFAAVRADMARLESANKADIAKLESATKADFAAVRADIASVKLELKADLGLLRHELTIRLGGMIMALGGVLIAIKFVGH